MDDSMAGSRMVAIYLDLNEKVHPVRRLVGSGRPELRPVLEHLLAGPTPEELGAGYTTAIPPACNCSGSRARTPTPSRSTSRASSAPSARTSRPSSRSPARAHRRVREGALPSQWSCAWTASR